MTFRVNGQNTLITTTGDIGVGTLTPNGNVSIFSNSANASIIISQAGNGLALHVARGNVLITGNVQVQGTLNACTYIIPAITAAGNSAFDSPTLFVDAVGHKVGVGKTQPNVKLDIVGAMNASTEIYAGTKLRVGPNNFQMIDTGSNSRLEFNSTSGFIVLNRDVNIMYWDIAGAKVLELATTYVYSPLLFQTDQYVLAPENRIRRTANNVVTPQRYMNERGNTNWRLTMGTQAAANAFSLDRFTEAGVYVDSPFSTSFSTGQVTIATNATVSTSGTASVRQLSSKYINMWRTLDTDFVGVDFYDAAFAKLKWSIASYGQGADANAFGIIRMNAAGSAFDTPIYIPEVAVANQIQFFGSTYKFFKSGIIQVNSTNVPNSFPFIVAASDQFSNLTAGNTKVSFRIPFAYTATGVRASLNVAQVSGNTINVDVNMNGNTALSTKIIFDNNVKTSVLCNTQPVLSVTSWPDDAEITIDIDSVGANTIASGLKVTILGYPSYS